MKRWHWVFALALPCVVLGAWLARLEWGSRVGEEVTLKVVAYDPRDLLSGHYLQYAVQYGLDPCLGQPQGVSEETCICLESSAAGTAVGRWTGVCTARPASCSQYLKGHCEYSRFQAGIERYYIPEDYSQILTRFPPNATIRVRLSGDGAAQITAFLVDGAPLAQFVAGQR